jgi:hypothetical protein
MSVTHCTAVELALLKNASALLALSADMHGKSLMCDVLLVAATIHGREKFICAVLATARV